ncbi:MAG: ATP-binding protein [Pirellulaceae bacterium]|nr:ATP-binding protein [Pirellulaceae bacterium]
MTTGNHSLPSPDDSIEIRERIDSGLYGSVYRAVQKPFGRQVAVKIIKTEGNKADALAHAAPLARVNHPAIVTVYTLKEIYIPELGNSVPAIVMEWVDGVTFGKRLMQSKFTIDEATLLCHDLLDGIEHLHSSGICHGDLHVGNIIILPTARAKIIDIDANKEYSLPKLSAGSQEGAKSSDIDYCRGAIFKAIRHSVIPLSVISNHETNLDGANSIDVLRRAVDSLISEANQMGFPNQGSPSSGQAEEWLDRLAIANAASDQVISLLDTQAYFDLMKLPYPTQQSGVLDRLSSEGLIRPTSSGWEITNLAAVMLAKKLDAFSPALARKAPRVVIYERTNKILTKDDKLSNRGYAVGFEALVDFVHSSAPQNRFIEEAVRQEVKMFPKQALRELIANALVHQDFLMTGVSVMIEMYDDRVEISNPGLPPIHVERFIDEFRSRNERLADLMRRLGICEEKGSGIDKVISASEMYQLPAPDFRVGQLRTTAILFAHQELEQMDRNDRIRACYQHCCLRYVMNEQMNNQSLRERFRLPEKKVATVTSIITATVDSGKIKLADPSQTSTRYRRYLPFWA